MKKKDLHQKQVKFSQEYLSNSGKKQNMCFTQRLSNTPGQAGPSFNSGMKPKENKVPSSFNAKPFSIPIATGRRSIMNDSTNRGSLPPAPPLVSGAMPLSKIENPNISTPMLNKIEMFKNTNFSLIGLMKDCGDNRSETASRYGGMSQISTPRLTPLKFLDRNRNQLLN
jgi:hypothetical protein